MKADTKFLTVAFSRLINYLNETTDGDKPVVEFLLPDDLEAKLDLRLDDSGVDEDTLLKFLDEYLRYSIRTGHNQFFNQLFSGFSAHAFVGEMVSAVTNTSMYTYEAAPVATLVETTVLKKMLDLVGFEDGNGTFTTGGSNGNLIAMLCARNRAVDAVKCIGLPDEALVAYVSEQAHYSFERASDLLGIGSDHIIGIPCHSNGQMNVTELELAIERSHRDGRIPFFVAATAGTTVKGAFDPLPDIAAVAKRHNLWFHVDGAFGGSVILSPTHKQLLTGSELADSFTWDAHKMLGAGLICSVILVKNGDDLSYASTVGGTDYLFHDTDGQEPDLGLNSMQCGRRVESLKLWFLWKHHGDVGLARHIDYLFELARYTEAVIEAHPRLQSMAPRQSVNLCFRYVPARYCSDLNALNIDIREKMRRDGLSFVNYSYIDGNVIIRLVLVNFDIGKTDIDVFFKRLLNIAEICSPSGRGHLNHPPSEHASVDRPAADTDGLAALSASDASRAGHSPPYSATFKQTP